MAKPTLPPSNRISASFKELSDSAIRLNSASDELAKGIGPIDTALKKLNLGVAAWHQYFRSGDQHGNYWVRRIGYAKVDGKWGLALSAESGNEGYGVEHEEEWLFNDAPRRTRLEALDHIPELLEELVRQVNKTAADLQKKSNQARELSETISALSAATQGRS